MSKRSYCVQEIDLAGRPAWVVDLNYSEIDERSLQFNTELTNVEFPYGVLGPFGSRAAARTSLAGVLRERRKAIRDQPADIKLDDTVSVYVSGEVWYRGNRMESDSGYHCVWEGTARNLLNIDVADYWNPGCEHSMDWDDSYIEFEGNRYGFEELPSDEDEDEDADDDESDEE